MIYEAHSCNFGLGVLSLMPSVLIPKVVAVRCTFLRCAHRHTDCARNSYKPPTAGPMGPPPPFMGGPGPIHRGPGPMFPRPGRHGDRFRPYPMPGHDMPGPHHMPPPPGMGFDPRAGAIRDYLDLDAPSDAGRQDFRSVVSYADL